MTEGSGTGEAPRRVSASDLERMAREVIQSEQGADEDSSTHSTLARVLLAEQYSGAFTHPAYLKQFDEVIRNGAERAFSLTEREQKHRHDCDNLIIKAETAAMESESEDRRLLIWLVFIVVMLALAASVVLIILDKTVGAGLLGGASLLVVLGGAFSYRQRRSLRSNVDTSARHD